MKNQDQGKHRKVRPLASVFLKRMLIAYVFFAIAISGVQLAIEYKNTRSEIMANLRSLAETFTPGAVSAIWDYQAHLLEALVNGFATNRIVVSVEVDAVSSLMHVEWKSKAGQIPSPDLTIIHDLYKSGEDGERRHIGTMKISSSRSLVYEKMQESFMHTLSVILMVLLLVGLTVWLLVRILVVRPLSGFSKKVEELAAKGIGHTIELESNQILEIMVMQQGFNLLMQQIVESHERIAEQNALLEQRVAERAKEVIEKEARFRSIFERANAGIAITDPDGNLIQVNDVFCSLLGYVQGELTGRNISDFTHPDDLEQEIKAFRDMDEGKRDEHRMEKRYIRYDGSVIWVDLAFTIIRDEHGCSANYIGLVVDISQRKLVEEELIRAKQMAESADRSKSEFLANMSHEIRTPMNAILGMAELALKTGLTPRQHDFVFKIKKAGRSLLGIINDILDFSKIEAGKLELDRTEFSVDTVMDMLSDLLAERVSEKGIELVISVDRRVPERLLGDPLRLGQILINLASNAVKFTERGEVIVMAVPGDINEDQALINFSVRDSGIGIEKELIPFLFQPFTQADGSTTRKFGGTGLGLSISRSIVEAMGGSLEVESCPGKGSTFYFSVKFDRPAKAYPVSVPRPAVTGLKILVVDDNEFSREIILGSLESMSFRVEVASSGDMALEMLNAANASDPFRLVILDWKMPGMDGICLAEIIRSRHEFHDIPIIMMTAYGREDAMIRARKVGVNAFLVKPIKHSVLFDTITEVSASAVGYAVEYSGRVPVWTPSGSRLSGVKILLVEDNKLNQEVASGILESENVKVDVASNGKEAVEAVLANFYDAVLMDVQMPVMDGFEASRLIRSDERFSDLPIIAMTANAMKGDRERCLENGMNDYVMKPIDPDRLFETITKWTGIRTQKEATVKKAVFLPEKRILTQEMLPGIDLSDALKRFIGNEVLLASALSDFGKEYEEIAGVLKNLIEKKDMDSARYLAHTLKGIVGNFSAWGLHGALKSLEIAINGGAWDDIDGCIENVQSEMSKLLEGVANLPESLIKGRSTIAGGEALTPEQLADCFRSLEDALLGNEFDSLERFSLLARNLPKDTDPGIINKLEKEISSFNFQDALESLRILDESIKNKGGAVH